MAVTKPHKSAQREALSIEQHNAIDLLVYGKPDREVAEAIGVTRETVTRWRNENPYFIAELNQKREELWRAAHDKLRGLVGKAIETLEKALDTGDMKAAVEILKAVKLYGDVGTPKGETAPELVLLQQAEIWAEQEIRRQGPPEDPLVASLVYDGAKARLIKQRLEELCKAHL
jgi:Helix-turn-helix of insertion element transposase